MNLLLRQKLINPFIQLSSRGFSSSPALNTKQWRVEKGLPKNRNAEGVLTDSPDYTFTDGRPTPLLHKQKQRLERQQKFAAQILELTAELEFAKKREQRILQEKEQERQRILGDRLKPKGVNMYKK